MIAITCLDDQRKFFMSAKTPYEAMKSLKYTLDLVHEDNKCIINKTQTGFHLWMDHSGKTYAVRNWRV